MDQNGVGGLITMTGGTEALRMHLTSDSECGAARLIDTAYSIFSFIAHKCRACPDLFTTWNTCITMYFPHIISQVISFMECCHLAHLYPFPSTPGDIWNTEKKSYHIAVFRSWMSVNVLHSSSLKHCLRLWAEFPAILILGNPLISTQT